MRVGLGPGVLMSYILQGLVHPARKVREVGDSVCFSLSRALIEHCPLGVLANL
jgi:hypothetical protein